MHRHSQTIRIRARIPTEGIQRETAINKHARSRVLLETNNPGRTGDLQICSAPMTNRREIITGAVEMVVGEEIVEGTEVGRADMAVEAVERNRNSRLSQIHNSNRSYLEIRIKCLWALPLINTTISQWK